jgi:hypothetical protein
MVTLRTGPSSIKRSVSSSVLPIKKSPGESQIMFFGTAMPCHVSLKKDTHRFRQV